MDLDPGYFDLFYRFGIALLLGMLIGLEREHSRTHLGNKMFAGVRTFALISLAGCMAALIGDELGSPFVLVAVIAVIGMWIALAYVTIARLGQVGITTEVSAMVALLAGILCYLDYVIFASAIAVSATLLLSLKPALHSFATALSREDVYATLKFAVITIIVLPILPNESFGPPPFDVLNPYRIWLMVVFISGISFASYVLMKVVSAGAGIGLTGLLGGLVSSTAVTLSLSQRSKTQEVFARSIALALIAAWTVMIPRILLQAGIVNIDLLQTLTIPLAVMGVSLLAYVGYLLFTRGEGDEDQVEVQNPFELKPAFIFGFIYGLILLLSRTAETYFGTTGIYVSSIIAGIADLNAITLTMAELSQPLGNLAPGVAAEAITLAVISNTVVKTILVFSAGSRALFRLVLPALVIVIVVGGGAIYWFH
ncbi:MAG: DUF4010 domain-containing protein [Litorilinea sp.]